MGYSDMVLEAVLNIKDYIRGASRQAITRYIESTFDKVLSLPSLRSALKKLVDDGSLIQTGQRFKLDKAKRAELRKPAPKKKKKSREKEGQETKEKNLQKEEYKEN